METIRAEEEADETVSYTVHIRLEKNGAIVHQEAQTFVREQAPKPERHDDRPK